MKGRMRRRRDPGRQQLLEKDDKRPKSREGKGNKGSAALPDNFLHKPARVHRGLKKYNRLRSRYGQEILR